MSFRQSAYDNWMEQAKHTLESARSDAARGDHSWSCFKAQQAAEFSLKALLHGLGLPAFGHSIKTLAKMIAETVPSFVIEGDRLVLLDKLYIPTRYADVFDDGAPFSYYTRTEALDAINAAAYVLSTIEETATSCNVSRGPDDE